MPLALPPADERSFASLVADARSRIPRLAPGWTDQNAHDPGITLLELFAHLTETDLYRLGRVTAAQRRAFLRWFGVEASGPSVAETVVALSIPAVAGPGPGPVTLETDREITSSPRETVFSTTAPVKVQAAGIAGLFTGARRIFTANPAVPAAVLEAPVAALGARGEDALVIALDRPVSGSVSLYFWTGDEDHGASVRRRLTDESAATLRDRSGGHADCPASRFDDWRRHHEVDLVWEVGTAAGWTPVSDVDDETRALSVSGFVRLRVSAALMAGALGAAPLTYTLRVRAARGRYEAPPILRAVLLNAVPARHQSRRFRIRLGSSDGRAGQTWRVPRNSRVPAPEMPLVFDQTSVFVAGAARPISKWTVAPDWDRAGPDSALVVVDAESAELRFGDGYRGRVPPAGAGVYLRSRVGGGANGNVGARTLTQVPVVAGAVTHLEVTQPFVARGGGPAPALAGLQARVLSNLARPTRAVTLADFERLTLETPGLPNGRVRAIADHHPGFPGLPASGCVTVVVVPRGVGAAPEPTPGFLTAVRAYLGRRRPVATELHVIGPTYTEVAVRAHLHLGPYADAAELVAEASTRLDAFFHPLTGGPDGGGWPVGRDVYRSEVLALLQEIPGVHHVDGLSLLVGPDREPRCHNVSVCPTDLVATTPHELTIAPSRIR